jgi:large subunit ribosomal protein L31
MSAPQVPVHAHPSDTATRRPVIEEDIMKSDIHPAYGETTVVCGCGNTFQTRSTKPGGRIVVEVCSQCHPFYTGKQKILDSGGRVARFEKRYGKRKAGTDKTDKASAGK